MIVKWTRYASAFLVVPWIQTLNAVETEVLVAERSRVAIVQKIATSVVAIFSSDGTGGGSGVLITPDGYALSNFHVTSECGEFMKCGLNDGKLYDAVIVGIDPTGDVALIKMLGRDDFPHAILGDSDTLNVGDWTYAMGNPFLLATDFQPTVTAGIVSGLHRYQYPANTLLEYTDCIQVDTSINPGNSGGPLFNAAGELVGINGRIAVEKRGRVNVGAGYAISLNQIQHFLDHLRGGHVVDHATLGATVTTGQDRTVHVDTILEHSDAYRRGLREGDEVVSFAGRPVGSVNQFKNILGIYPNGWSLPLVYRREGMKHEIIVELRALHRATELQQTPEAKSPRRPPQEHPDPRKEGDEASRDKPPTEELPEEYRRQFVKKAGYANYYFNQQQQQRVLRGMETLQSWRSSSGRWKLTGRTGTHESFTLTMSNKGLGLQLPNRPGLQPLEGADYLDEPPGSGGLLAALQQLKLFLTLGPEAFAEFFYLGSHPLDGRGVLVDVLLTRQGGVETLWYFQKSDHLFIGFDSALGTDVDPCEIRFQQFGDFGGKLFPSHWTVRHGIKEFATFEVLTFDVGVTDGDKPPNSADDD